MNILVVGGGGREHAIIKKPEKEPPGQPDLCRCPGNGGIAADAICVPASGPRISTASSPLPRSNAIDFAVVAPDDPLALGAVDALEAAGIPCFGPDAKAPPSSRAARSSPRT